MYASVGQRGIRTPGTVSRTPVFKTGAFNRSATSPATTVLLQSPIFPGGRHTSVPHFQSITHRRCSGTAVFKTARFNHSRIPLLFLVGIITHCPMAHASRRRTLAKKSEAYRSKKDVQPLLARLIASINSEVAQVNGRVC